MILDIKYKFLNNANVLSSLVPSLNKLYFHLIHCYKLYSLIDLTEAHQPCKACLGAAYNNLLDSLSVVGN